ncbi:hypothetical protein [Streptosporangium sp. NPDC002721]|uniref:hypothetical protein n=1 Tax=Streptosporangium sp. NPDC002721 TaxID=3366188 RepID=UPI0036B94CA5
MSVSPRSPSGPPYVAFGTDDLKGAHLHRTGDIDDGKGERTALGRGRFGVRASLPDGDTRAPSGHRRTSLRLPATPGNRRPGAAGDQPS